MLFRISFPGLVGDRGHLIILRGLNDDIPMLLDIERKLIAASPFLSSAKAILVFTLDANSRKLTAVVSRYLQMGIKKAHCASVIDKLRTKGE